MHSKAAGVDNAHCRSVPHALQDPNTFWILLQPQAGGIGRANAPMDTLSDVPEPAKGMKHLRICLAAPEPKARGEGQVHMGSAMRYEAPTIPALCLESSHRR